MSPKKIMNMTPMAAVLLIFFIFNMVLVVFIYLICKR